MSRGGKFLGWILSLVLVLGLFAAIPPAESYAAPGDILTIKTPVAIKGDIQIYYYDTKDKTWRFCASTMLTPISATQNEAGFRTLDYYDSTTQRTESAVGKQLSFQYTTDSNNNPAALALNRLYGSRQVYGGYFGGVSEFSRNNYASPAPRTFTVAAGRTTNIDYTPVRGAVTTLKVTPADVPNRLQTGVSVYKVVKTPSGKTNHLVWMSQGNNYAVDNANGTYTLTLQPNLTYTFEASGAILQGKVWVNYPNTWLGGHKGSSNNAPKKLKTFKAPGAGGTKSAGTIKLALGKSTIKGKASIGNNVRIMNPFTGLDYSFVPTDTASYSQSVEPGFYIVMSNGEVKFIAVKNKKSARVNFSTNSSRKYDNWFANLSIKVTGKLKAGSKLKASTKAYNLPFKMKAPKFKYIWTDGTKILGKKATYKLKKADLKKGKKIFVIAYAKKYGSTQYDWHTVR
jgi:hypothetical protein